jgi:hypothetical protein
MALHAGFLLPKFLLPVRSVFSRDKPLQFTEGLSYPTLYGMSIVTLKVDIYNYKKEMSSL